MGRHQFSISEVVKVLLLTGIVTIWFTGCSHNSTGSNSNSNMVQIMSIQSHDNVLTDGDGKVLYFFAPDVKGDSKCEGGCIVSWPVYNADQIKVGAGLQATDFGKITRSDGGTQVTYKGWPLYYFGQDAMRGDTKGVSVPQPGVWPVLNGDTPAAP